MFPAPTSNFPGIGHNIQLGTGSGFDPIAARDPDGLKFCLADYKIEAEREAESRHVTRTGAEKTRTQRESDIVRNSRAPESAP